MCDTPPLTLKPPTCFLHALHPLQGAGMVMSRMVLKAKLEDGRQSSSLHPRMTVWSREYPFPTSKSYLGLFAGREITLYSIWSATIWGYLYFQIIHYYTIHWASQVALVIKNPPANAGNMRDVGSIPGLGRSSGGGHSNPLQYSCLENPMDREAWKAVVHRVTKSWTQLKWLSTYCWTDALEILA